MFRDGGSRSDILHDLNTLEDYLDEDIQIERKTYYMLKSICSSADLAGFEHTFIQSHV